jgi:hypothetical protein
MRKSTKQKKNQVVGMETLTETIPIAFTYIVIVEKKSPLTFIDLQLVNPNIT